MSNGIKRHRNVERGLTTPQERFPERREVGPYYLLRTHLAQWDVQVGSDSERIKLGQCRARAKGNKDGQPFVLNLEQMEQLRKVAEEGVGLHNITKVITCSPVTAKEGLSYLTGGCTALARRQNQADGFAVR